MRVRNTIAIVCLTLLFFGFNNCSNDTRFSAANKTKTQASNTGNGTPYGGNNGTPYGGIRKGSYLAFSNSVCPAGQKESIEVIQNADNSLLVTANYECRSSVDVVEPDDISVADSGTHVVYRGKVYTHDKQEAVTQSDMRVNLICQKGAGSAPALGGGTSAQVIYYSGTDRTGNFAHFIDRVDYVDETDELVAYTQKVRLEIQTVETGVLRHLATQPVLEMHFQVLNDVYGSASFSSTLFSAAENQTTSEMTCQILNEDSVEFWNDPRGQPEVQ